MGAGLSRLTVRKALTFTDAHGNHHPADIYGVLVSVPHRKRTVVERVTGERWLCYRQGSEPRKAVAMRRERSPVPEEQTLGSRVRQVLVGLSGDKRGGQSQPSHPETPRSRNSSQGNLMTCLLWVALVLYMQNTVSLEK